MLSAEINFKTNLGKNHHQQCKFILYNQSWSCYKSQGSFSNKNKTKNRLSFTVFYM